MRRRARTARRSAPRCCKRLDEIEAMVNRISIPLAFADALYGLRSHINFVRQRVRAAAAPGAAQPPSRLPAA